MLTERSTLTAPPCVAHIRRDGTGEVIIAGVTHLLACEDLDAVRIEAMILVAETAADLAQPVPVFCTEPDGVFKLVINPDGSVDTQQSPPLPQDPTRFSSSDRSGPALFDVMGGNPPPRSPGARTSPKSSPFDTYEEDADDPESMLGWDWDAPAPPQRDCVIILSADGQGGVQIDDHVTAVMAPDLMTARRRAIGVVCEEARRKGDYLFVVCQDPEGAFRLLVSPDGNVTEAAPPPGGLESSLQELRLTFDPMVINSLPRKDLPKLGAQAPLSPPTPVTRPSASDPFTSFPAGPPPQPMGPPQPKATPKPTTILEPGFFDQPPTPAPPTPRTAAILEPGFFDHPPTPAPRTAAILEPGFFDHPPTPETTQILSRSEALFERIVGGSKPGSPGRKPSPAPAPAPIPPIPPPPPPAPAPAPRPEPEPAPLPEPTPAPVAEPEPILPPALAPAEVAALVEANIPPVDDDFFDPFDNINELVIAVEPMIEPKAEPVSEPLPRITPTGTPPVVHTETYVFPNGPPGPGPVIPEIQPPPEPKLPLAVPAAQAQVFTSYGLPKHPPTPAMRPLAPPPPIDRGGAEPSRSPFPQEITASGMLRPEPVKRSGFRRKPSAGEMAERAYRTAVAQHWPGPRTIAVVNGKGGAGKTPTTICLSAVFARYGGTGVLAWDNNQTRGTLGWRTEQGHHDATLLDLLPDVPRLMANEAFAADISRYVHHQVRDMYDVLRSNSTLLASAQRITPDNIDAIWKVAAKFYRLIIMDSGNDESDPMWLRMIDHADQLVTVTTTRADHAEAGALLLEALQNRDERSARLARNSVAVITQADAKATNESITRIRKGYAGLSRDVVMIPYDPMMVEGALAYDDLRPSTQRAWLIAAASVAQGLSAGEPFNQSLS